MGNSRKASKIMVIRHAEKPPNDPPPYGVTWEGEFDKESLTVRGWQRAGALACLFAPTYGALQTPSLARPQFLYASKAIKQHGSHRPTETILPLAEKLGIRINTKYPKDGEEEMLEDALSCDGVVLICWQREYIPAIANHILGDRTTAPQSWPEGRFDLVWVFDLAATSGGYKFMEVPQCLLSGDSPTPIK
jgi:hypothetical protein